MTDTPLTKAAQDVLAERKRQISVEGWTSAHDGRHYRGQMARAAAAYALTSTFHIGDTAEQHRKALWGLTTGFSSIIQRIWPWHPNWYKPKNQRHDLVKAGALILAEIERIDRRGSRQ